MVLVLAVAGTAIAGPDPLTSKITKSKVKAIAAKQADRKITSRAPGLAVASAETSQTAQTAQTAETAETAQTAQTAASANPTAFAHISAAGVVDSANSKGVAQANVTVGNFPGYACLSGLGFTPRGGVATIDWDTVNLDTIATFGLGPGSECPAGTQAFVDTRKPDGTGTLPAAFFLVLYG